MCADRQRNHDHSVEEKSFAELVDEAKSAVPAISPRAANEQHTNSPETVFLDPRDAAGIAATTGIIPGALNLPLATLNGTVDAELPEEFESRTRPIIAACQAGPMGALAAHALKKRGYSNVCFIDGGTQAWLDAGYATVK